ncbi:MAG: hypothetical protein E7164_04010 [Firmicutes bacterium]|nr:hypothetical protein [Bacillota bacterium]
MKKVCVYIILLSFLFIGIKSVDASICTYSEQAQLNQKAAKIKVVYEEATGILDPSLYDCQADNEDPESCNASYNYFVVSILNMTEDFYITVQNNINNKQKTYYYSDAKDGMISFDWEEIMNIATLTFKVYSSSETGCPRENYRTIYQTLPRKNLYHYYGLCTDNPDYYLCQKYVTFEEMPFYDFMEKINKYTEQIKEEKKEETPQGMPQQILGYFTENIPLVLGVSGVVVLLVVVIVVVLKKRKRRIL